ncbi:MAG: signal peptidase II [Solirubrobacteraceae bacterium]
MASGSTLAWRRAGVVAAAVIVLDQSAKAAIRGGVALGGQRSVIPGVLVLVHSQNSGVAFSALSGSTVIVTLLALAVLGALLAFFARFASQPLLWLPAGLIAGGALGNLIDRLRDGSVTDFIKLPDWPAFNLADSAITVGVVVLVLVIGRGGAARSS